METKNADEVCAKQEDVLFYISDRPTSMSDAAQVVEDVVKCRVCLLTCLGNQNSGLNVYETAQSTCDCLLALCYYHNENS